MRPELSRWPSAFKRKVPDRVGISWQAARERGASPLRPTTAGVAQGVGRCERERFGKCGVIELHRPKLQGAAAGGDQDLSDMYQLRRPNPDDVDALEPERDGLDEQLEHPAFVVQELSTCEVGIARDSKLVGPVLASELLLRASDAGHFWNGEERERAERGGRGDDRARSKNVRHGRAAGRVDRNASFRIGG